MSDEMSDEMNDEVNDEPSDEVHDAGTAAANDPVRDGRDPTPTGGRPSSPGHRRRLQLGAVAAVVVLLLAGGGWWLWHEDHSFCHEVAELPDLATSMDQSGSPSDGLVAYADQLDQVADEAPDAQTAAAARALAAAQRATGQALSGDPMGTTAASIVAATPDTALTTARQDLQQAIDQQCPG